MEFRILGPLEVEGDPGPVALGGVKPRAVLAMLLLHANQPVSAERLAVALWGDEAPAGAVKTVQVHVSRLRKALGDPDVVRTTPAGYRLRVRPGELDAERFAATTEQGRRALESGDNERAAALLRDALALWRGPALAELAFEPFAPAEIERLEEQRLAAVEARVEADLACGRHVALVGELGRLVADHPTREGFARSYMLALYRSGRQADALETYQRARRVLVGEIGVEPGPELRRLEDAILRQDPALDLAESARELPRELETSSAPPLAGRDEALAWLREHWDRARAGEGTLVMLLGAAGMGKTRLAGELAGEVHRDGTDVIYAGGRGPPAASMAALGRAGEASRPTLVVVDDADRARGDVLARLRELADRSVRRPVLVLVTSRRADVLDDLGPHGRMTLEALDDDAVRSVASFAMPWRADGEIPVEWLREASGGVPRRVHELAGRAARREATQRVGTTARRTAAGRAELQSMESELTGDVLDLQAVRDRVARAGAEETPVTCPFKGLAAFDVADAPFFFGRERLVAELVARLVGAPLLGVVGPSGSGKSSVVRAGLLPALAGGVLPGSEAWAQVVIRPGEDPMGELRRATAGLDRDRRVVLAVDQFEETFTTCRDEGQRRAFIDDLARNRQDRVVVIAVRADHYGRCATYPALARLLPAHHVLVAAMRHDELARAVERPAERVGLRVDPELTHTLVADVEHEPGALPMLSTALLELWQRRDGRRLRLGTYESTGGVRGAVARHAEEAFALLTTEQQDVARRTLLRLASDDGAGGVERRRVPLAELDTDAGHEVVALLADQRLLTVSAGAVEVAHEALLREWPRLRGWLEEDADGRRLHRHLADAAREWDARGRDAGELYRGARLAGALEWRGEHAIELNHSEQAFLDTAERELQAGRARRRRALALGIALLAVIAGISTVVAVRGIQRARFEQRAAASRNLAVRALTQVGEDPRLAALLALKAFQREPTVEARSAILAALPVLHGDRRIGRPLEHGIPLEAVAISPDGRTLAAAADDGAVSLWDVATRRRLGAPLTGHLGIANDVTFSPDGTLLASGGQDQTVRLWHARTGRPSGRPLEGHTESVSRVDFSPDGKTLVSVGSPVPEDGASLARVRLWDVGTRRPLGRPFGHTLGMEDVDFHPDGLAVATAGSDEEVVLWETATHRRRGRPLTGHDGWVLAVGFSPDGDTVASGAWDGKVRLWDARTGRPLGRPLADLPSSVNAVAFSPDGATIAAADEGGTVWLWSVATRRVRRVLVADSTRSSDAEAGATDAPGAGVLGVAFSPRGDILASTSAQAVQLWDVRARGPVGRPLRGHDGWVRGLAFTSSGVLASGGVDRTVRLWDGRTHRAIGDPLPHPSPVLGVAADSDGHMVATAGEDGTVRLWDGDTQEPLGPPLAGHRGTVKAIAMTADGDTLASGGHDATVRLWDTNTHLPIGPPIESPGGPVNGVALDADGETLAAAGQDGAIALWNTETREPLGSLSGPTGFVNAVAFSPIDDIVAGAGQDGSVWLWNVKTRRPLGQPLAGHTGIVETVAFTPDGATLATAGADGTVRLWDVATRQALGGPLEGHRGTISAVAFSPDGTRLASAGEDATVRLWDPLLWSADRGALERRVCAAVHDDLTREEWNAFLPDQPYERTCPAPR